MAFGLGILSDLRAVAKALQSGDLLAAATIAVTYTGTPDDDRAIVLVHQIMDSEDPEVWFKSGVEILALGAKYTPSELDDEILSAINASTDTQVYTDLVNWVRSLFHYSPVPLANTFGSFPAGSEGEPDKAIPLPVLISLASLIANLIRLIRKDK